MALGRIWAEGIWDLNIWDQSIWDQTAPIRAVSARVANDGDSLTISFSEVASIGAGGNGGFALTMSGGAVTLTYASGDDSDALVYNTSRTIASGETGTLAYTQPGDGIEDSGGADLASFSALPVSNRGARASRAQGGMMVF